MVTFSSLRWPEDREFLSQMFAILHANMSRIVPTGDSYEQGYAMWSQAKEVEYANSPSRSVVLIRLDGNIAGYFQYSILGDTFKMEDIQFDPAVQGRYNLFRLLYEYLLQIPQIAAARCAWANVSKQNLKSIAVLTRLGLRQTLEKERSFHFTGEMSSLRAWLQDAPLQR